MSKGFAKENIWDDIFPTFIVSKRVKIGVYKIGVENIQVEQYIGDNIWIFIVCKTCNFGNTFTFSI